jgi:hypothetical protein
MEDVRGAGMLERNSSERGAGRNERGVDVEEMSGSAARARASGKGAREGRRRRQKWRAPDGSARRRALCAGWQRSGRASAPSWVRAYRRQGRALRGTSDGRGSAPAGECGWSRRKEGERGWGEESRSERARMTLLEEHGGQEVAHAASCACCSGSGTLRSADGGLRAGHLRCSAPARRPHKAFSPLGLPLCTGRAVVYATHALILFRRRRGALEARRGDADGGAEQRVASLCSHVRAHSSSASHPLPDCSDACGRSPPSSAAVKPRLALSQPQQSD